MVGIVSSAHVHLLVVGTSVAAANPCNLLLLGCSFGCFLFHCSPFSQGILLNSLIVLIIEVLIDRCSNSLSIWFTYT